MKKHESVMVKEVLDVLALKPGQNVIDGTLGGGGHAKHFLDATAPTGKLLGFEIDPTAREIAADHLQSYSERYRIIPANARDLGKVYEEVRSFLGPVHAVFYDLGLSSFLIQQKDKGISFLEDGPLDMRFNAAEPRIPFIRKRRNFSLDELRQERGEALTAYDLVNYLDEKELADLIHEHGEAHSRSIAHKIAKERVHKPFATTGELIRKIFPFRHGKTHPATKTFQALRVAVNDELGALESMLIAAWDVLEEGGKIVVLSYHSLEDRIVKNYFKSSGGIILTPKPLSPQWDEIKINRSARSAKLRALQKTKN